MDLGRVHCLMSKVSIYRLVSFTCAASGVAIEVVLGDLVVPLGGRLLACQQGTMLNIHNINISCNPVIILHDMNFAIIEKQHIHLLV